MNDAESASAVPSHLEGGNWQSFEGRMRRRRADRCLAAAQQALRDGRPQDARAALDEAVRLVPDLSGAEAVARCLAGARGGRRSRGRWAAAAAVIAAAGLTIAIRGDWRSAFEFQTRAGESAANTRAGTPAPQTARPASVRIEIERINPKVTLDSAPAAVDPPVLPDRRVLEARAATEDATPPSAPPPSNTVSRPQTKAEPKPQPTQPGPQPAEPRPQPAAPTVTATTQPKPQPLPAPSNDLAFIARAEPPTAPADTPPTAQPKPERTPELPPAAPAVTASASRPAPAPPPETSRDGATVDEEEAIRAVLSRYAAAYSMLDASAARAVWPAVNERALARAFDSLASQQVSLSSCDIALVDTDAAHANCSGTTTWEPKVGRGPKSQPHRWSFQLARNGSRWAIVDATVK